MKISFKNDYSEGCHPLILEKLQETNLIQTVEGNYGEDRYSLEAKKLIHSEIQNPKSEIHFVSGGTQANLLVISAILRPHEAVIAASSAHIAVHETGAIEATGHKVIEVNSLDGKLTKEAIHQVLIFHQDEHMVKPKMVYISNSTELGSFYNKRELSDLRNFCMDHNLYLFMDGARLGSAITASKNDLTLKDIAELTDVFYIGGTKNGALLGEAIVINNPKLQSDFRYHTKQKGALLAKGRLLGIQFLVLFTDRLFYQIGESMNYKAAILAKEIQIKGNELWMPIETNQVFVIFDNQKIENLKKDFNFELWKALENDRSVIRLVTSWATPESYITRFLDKL